MKNLTTKLYDGAEDIVFMKTDDNGNPIKESKKYIFPSQNPVLADGLYSIYKGDGWILGDPHPKGLINSVLLRPGQTGGVTKSITTETQYTIEYSASASFDFKFIQLSVQAAFSTTISDSETREINISETSPAGKDLYLKVYSKFIRYDVIRVEKGKILDSGTTYVFSGGWGNSISGPTGVPLDQGLLYEPLVRIVLQPITPITEEIMDRSKDVIQGPIDLIKNMIGNLFQYSTPDYSVGTASGIIFDLSLEGTFDFLSGRFTNFILYKVGPNGENITRLISKAANEVNDTHMQVNLRTGRYMIKMYYGDDFKPSSGSISYHILIQKR